MLDVTYNPLVAAFFASSPHDGDAGVIYRYRITPENVIDAEKTSPGWFDVLYSVEPGHPLLIKPKKWDKRIEAQDGAFVITTIAQDLTHPSFYTNKTRDSEVEIIWITPKLKSQVRRYLEGKGINEVRLFPSIEQFARNHRVSDPLFLGRLVVWRKFRAIDRMVFASLWSCGVVRPSWRMPPEKRGKRRSFDLPLSSRWARGPVSSPRHNH